MRKGFILILILPLVLGSCAQIFKKDRGFRETQAVAVNGAMVRSGLKPMGGKQGFSFSAMIYAAGVGSTDGPFLWRVEAEGQQGVHEWLRVNQVRVSTEKTNRKEEYPRSNLGVEAPFKKDPSQKGGSFAQYQIPGKLAVKPEIDGRMTIHLNVSIKASGRVKSEWIKFELDPETKWTTDSVFFPSEIVKSFRGNPRGWKW